MPSTVANKANRPLDSDRSISLAILSLPIPVRLGCPIAPQKAKPRPLGAGFSSRRRLRRP
ncbi:hypothetical protein JCM14720_17060 [Calditerricola yamamurae]